MATRGVILASSAGMADDDWFAGKVIIVTSYSSGDDTARGLRRIDVAPTEGIVVNVPLPAGEAAEARRKMRISDGVDDHADEKKDHPVLTRTLLGVGGPVTDSSEWVHIHDLSGVEGARQLAPRVHIGGDVAEVLSRNSKGQGTMSLFFGKSVLGPGQLEFEISQGGWGEVLRKTGRLPTALFFQIIKMYSKNWQICFINKL